MSSRLVCLLLFVTLAFSLVAFAQAPATDSSSKAAPQIHRVPAAYTDPSSGKEMFNAYCASCHGVDGKGNGPAAAALKVPPTDLTMLAAKNKGEFPAAHVATVIKGDGTVSAHGGKDMPVWGPVFLMMGNHHEAEVQQRVANLTQYIRQMQQK